MLDPVRTYFETAQDYPEVPLLLARLIIGFVFVVAVRNKLKDVPAFADHNGLSVPVAWALTFAEAAGGIGIILGVLTQLAALVIMGAMTGSITFHVYKWKSPYWAAGGGWEYDLMIFSIAAVILVVGGGGWEIYPMV